MDTLLDVAAIVKRAKLALNLKNDSELADYLGVSRATVSNWCARNRIDFHLLLAKMKDVDYNWLFMGKGTPVHEPKFCDSELAPGEIQIIHTPKTPDKIDDRSVSLYDVSAAANLKTILTNKHQSVMGKIQIPSVPQCDGAIFVNGDSMYPILKSGDIVGFKEVSSFNAIDFGNIYVVTYVIDGDEYLVVKYVQRADEPGYVRLASYNTHHEPKDIPFTAITAIALVKFSIRKYTAI